MDYVIDYGFGENFTRNPPATAPGARTRPLPKSE